MVSQVVALPALGGGAVTSPLVRTPSASAESTNVLRYGADPTGVNDSTAAINEALARHRHVIATGGRFRISRSNGNSAITLNAGQIFEGRNGATLSVEDHDTWAITGTAISDISVVGWIIVGNGSTGTEGFKGGRGIQFDGVSRFRIADLKISDLGNMNTDPTDDAAHGGFGICIANNAADSFDGTIARCRIQRIAGGGMHCGDGIMVAKWAGSPIMSDIRILDCFVSTCGRDCYSIATSEGLPTRIKLIRCHGEKSAASGVDFEDATECSVEDSYFRNCGNDQTYFDPVRAYGPTYRLCAGMATGNIDAAITWIRCRVTDCYYGMTFGATRELRVQDCEVLGSKVSDIWMSLAGGAAPLRLSHCVFRSPLDCLGYHSQSVGPHVIVHDCEFAGRVIIHTARQSRFEKCTFKRGLNLVNKGCSEMAIVGNRFLDWNGPGVSLPNALTQAQGLVIKSNQFEGAGALSCGIEIAKSSAEGMVIENNVFRRLNISGIRIADGDDQSLVQCIKCNLFNDMPTAISVDNRGVRDCQITENKFENISAWCVDFPNLGLEDHLIGVVIVKNHANNVSGGGVRLAGASDLRLSGDPSKNDFSRCQGSPWLRTGTR